MTENRQPEGRANGRFAPGHSGNPGGRSKAMAEVKEKFKEIMPNAIDELERIIHSPKARDCDKLTAIRLAAEYALGKAPQAVSLEVQTVFETPESRMARIKELTRQMDDE